jgi:hypothetical protein
MQDVAVSPYFVIVARRNLFKPDPRSTLITLRAVFAGTEDASVEGSTDTPLVLQLPAKARSVLVCPPKLMEESSVRKTTISFNFVESLLSMIGNVGAVPSLPPNP